MFNNRRAKTEPLKDEGDEDKAADVTSITHHNAQHWQGACQLIDCRLGLLEGKAAASSCYRSSGSWRNSFEDIPSWSKSAAVAALKRHESVAMLPYLLSNLAVARTRSEPCIFGKDFLRITLPLPGEPSCEVNASSADHAERATSRRSLSCDALSLIGSETQGADSVTSLFPSLTSEGQSCDEMIPMMTDLCSYLRDGHDSLDDVARPIPDVFKVSNGQAFRTGLKKPRQDPHGAESSPSDWNVGESLSCATGSKAVAARTSQWDDWWTCQLDEFSVVNGEIEQDRDKFKVESCTPALADDVDEDENYIMLDEQEEECRESCTETETYHGIGDAINLEHVHFDSSNEELHPAGQSWNLSGYREDDIWSDEHFVSSQAKGFPPPISILANETHPGLPSHVPKTLWRSVKKNGRFVLQELQARPREFFQATRESGRLRLQLVRPDSDSPGSYTETVSSLEDKEGSLISSESVGNFARSFEVYQEEVESETTGAGSITSLVVESSSQGIKTSQVEDEELRERGAAPDEGSSMSRNLPILLSCQHHTTPQQEHADANSGERVKVMLGSRTSADVVDLEEHTNQTYSDLVVEGSCVANHNAMVEETPGKRVDDKSFADIMDQELRELDACNQASGMPRLSHISATYGFDNNLNVLSSSQTLMQLPIQSAV